MHNNADTTLFQAGQTVSIQTLNSYTDKPETKTQPNFIIHAELSCVIWKGKCFKDSTDCSHNLILFNILYLKFGHLCHIMGYLYLLFTYDKG